MVKSKHSMFKMEKSTPRTIEQKHAQSVAVTICVEFVWDIT